MAGRPLALTPRWPGALAGALVLALTLGTLAAVFWRAGGTARLAAADWAAIRFTVWQAALSAVLSVGFAIPVARALARRCFPGRNLLIALLGAPFVLPVIVAIFGLIAVFGRRGLLNAGLGALGLPEISIYGPQGVILAHVFFNLPLATRLILHGWLSVPSERFRLAASLGVSVGRTIEWPMLRQVVPGAALAVFLICLTSFAVALVLGGGPRATTVELAIYQALRFDFDLGRAALLASVQFGLCVIGAGLAWGLTAEQSVSGGLGRVVRRWDLGSGWGDALWIVAAAALLMLPLAMAILPGLPHVASLPGTVWQAALRSLAVALCSTALSVTLALALSLRPGRGSEVAGVLPLAVSSLVLGTGLFLMLAPVASPTKLALPLTALVNALLALPFVYRAIRPAVAETRATHGPLAASLGLRGVFYLRRVLLPRIARPLGFGAGLAAALSMGDLGVIALFGGADTETLPLAMYRLMGAYRTEAAAGAAVVLMVSSFALFWIFDTWGRRRAEV